MQLAVLGSPGSTAMCRRDNEARINFSRPLILFPLEVGSRSLVPLGVRSAATLHSQNVSFPSSGEMPQGWTKASQMAARSFSALWSDTAEDGWPTDFFPRWLLLHNQGDSRKIKAVDSTDTKSTIIYRLDFWSTFFCQKMWASPKTEFL